MRRTCGRTPAVSSRAAQANVATAPIERHRRNYTDLIVAYHITFGRGGSPTGASRTLADPIDLRVAPAGRPGRRRWATARGRSLTMGDVTVLRGGTVVDGTGAPGVAGRRGDRATAGSSSIGAGLRRRRVDRRDRLRRRARLHRHPHALRRPGVLGPGAHAVVLPRRHHRRRRQLRVLASRRPGPSTAT